ncbi:MAG: hypothetical protein IKE69_04350 [Thermoguttaceae bacterium]|nr:hypothetical protein [Thermoguttaceae bacterium]
MSGSEPHYKGKNFFWKWKARRGAGDPPPESGGEKAPFWTSWSGSLMIHAAILLLLLTVFQIHRPISRALRGRPDGEVSLVFSDEEPGGSGEAPADTEPEPEHAETAADPAPPEPVAETAVETIGTESRRDGATARVRFAADDDGETRAGTGSGESAGPGSGDGQTVRFGELSGRGKRFVFLIDHSESMKWPDEAPMNFAVSEARRSIESLEPNEGARKFQLVVFNHNVAVFDGGTRLTDVTPESKRRAVEFLRTVRPEGGTDPLGALSAAIRMAPDVIFLLTDAEEEISALALRRIGDLARRTGVAQINVIEFGKPGGKHPAAYRKLAEENGGTYLYKEVTRLK